MKDVYINENNFCYNGIDYERDTENGRCYILEASISLKKRDGWSARKKTDFKNAL